MATDGTDAGIEPRAGSADGAGDEPGAAASPQRSTIEKIRNLPAPVGVLLVGAGMAGMVLPGPMGTPLILAGGLVLAPKTFGKFERFLEQRFPEMHRTGLEAVERFIADMEKRFPGQKARSPSVKSADGRKSGRRDNPPMG